MIVALGDLVVLLVVPLDNRVVGIQPFQGVPSMAVPMVVLLHLGAAPAVDLGNLGDNFAAGHLENPDNHRDPGVHRADRENFHTRADRPYPGAGVAVDHTVVDTDFVDSVGLDDHEDRPSYHPNQVPFHLLVAILTSEQCKILLASLSILFSYLYNIAVFWVFVRHRYKKER